MTLGKFVPTFANSEHPDETALNEPSHQDFHCLLKHPDETALIRIFTVCLFSLFFISMKHPNLADCPNLPDFTLPFLCFISVKSFVY